MKRALVLCASFLASCGPQAQVPNCNRVSIISGTTPVAASLAGQPVTLELLALANVICASGGPVATDVVVEVRDARNLVVAETHTTPRKTSNGSTTDVTFTPTTPGVYFIDARFEPAVGATQRAHLVVADRAGQPAELISSLTADCDALHPLGDTLACATSASVTFWRDGHPVGAAIDGPGLEADSDDGVLWVRTSTSLLRFEAGDGGLSQTGAPWPLRGGGVGVTADRYVAARDAELRSASFTDGGLVTTTAVLPEPVSGGGLAFSGDALGWSTPAKVCALTADGGAGCRPLESTRSLAERDVLWVRTKSASSGFAQWRVFDDASPPSLRPVPASSSLVDVSQQRPVFSWSGRFVSVRRDDLVFEAWPLVADVRGVTVTPSHVVLRQRDGRVLVYRR